MPCPLSTFYKHFASNDPKRSQKHVMIWFKTKIPSFTNYIPWFGYKQTFFCYSLIPLMVFKLICKEPIFVSGIPSKMLVTCFWPLYALACTRVAHSKRGVGMLYLFLTISYSPSYFTNSFQHAWKVDIPLNVCLNRKKSVFLCSVAWDTCFWSSPSIAVLNSCYLFCKLFFMY